MFDRLFEWLHRRAVERCKKLGHRIKIVPKTDEKTAHTYLSTMRQGKFVDPYICKRCGHKVVVHGWWVEETA